jgi:hypothetical protein
MSDRENRYADAVANAGGAGWVSAPDSAAIARAVMAVADEERAADRDAAENWYSAWKDAKQEWSDTQARLDALVADMEAIVSDPKVYAGSIRERVLEVLNRAKGGDSDG